MMNSSDETALNSNTSVNNEDFLEKIALFKEKHFQLKNLCIELVNENEILRKKQLSLECQSLSEQDNNSTNTIIRKQERIIELFKKKDNYIQLKTVNDNLNQKIEELKSQLEENKAQYEQEMQELLENCNAHAQEINRIKEKDDREKSELRKAYDELQRENEKLRAAYQSIEIETSQVIASLDLKHQNEMMILKSENRTLLDELHKQEKLYQQKMQNSESNNRELLKKLTRGNRKITLDEAFDNNETIGGAKKIVSSQRRFSPLITDDDSVKKM